MWQDFVISVIQNAGKEYMYKKRRNSTNHYDDGLSPKKEKTNQKVVLSKHNNIFNNVKFATCFGYK